VRVIHVAPTGFGPDGLFGGGERYPLELARALAEHVDCELVTFGRDHGNRRDGRLQIRVLRPLGYLGGHPARAIVPSLPSVIRGADIVHVHQMRSPPSVIAAMTARVRRIPTAVTDHGLQGTEWGGLVPRLFDRFLTVSRYSAAELGAPLRRTRVIYGGADPAHHRPDPHTRRDGVLFVGRLTPHKGVDVLIRALPPDARLTVIGSEGHDRQAPERDYPELLRSLAVGRRVEFLGPVDDDELSRRYRTAAVLVIPSVERTFYGRQVAVSELLGLVALEAMGTGLPVVASRLGGLPEVIEDGVTGYLVPPGDIAALHARIGDLLADPAAAGRLGANGRARVLAELTWDRCAQRCLDAYRELLDGRGLTTGPRR
jgi:glycosyltransferase involved in cell wall biosynthesis